MPKSDSLLEKEKKEITVLNNPNKDNSGVRERKPEKAHCLQKINTKKGRPRKEFMAECTTFMINTHTEHISIKGNSITFLQFREERRLLPWLSHVSSIP